MDSEDIDHWKVDKYSEEDAKGNTLIDETVFTTLFPKYRETYLREWWPQVAEILKTYVCHFSSFLSVFSSSSFFLLPSSATQHPTLPSFLIFGCLFTCLSLGLLYVPFLFKSSYSS